MCQPAGLHTFLPHCITPNRLLQALRLAATALTLYRRVLPTCASSGRSSHYSLTPLQTWFYWSLFPPPKVTNPTRILVHQGSNEISQQTTKSLKYASVIWNTSFSPSKTKQCHSCWPLQQATCQSSALHHPSLHSLQSCTEHRDICPHAGRKAKDSHNSHSLVLSRVCLDLGFIFPSFLGKLDTGSSSAGEIFSLPLHPQFSLDLTCNIYPLMLQEQTYKMLST